MWILRRQLPGDFGDIKHGRSASQAQPIESTTSGDIERCVEKVEKRTGASGHPPISELL